MVKTTTRGISEYDLIHSPPTHTFHPTTKKELRRYHTSLEESHSKDYPYVTPGSFEHIEEHSNAPPDQIQRLRLDMLRQEFEKDREQGFPEWNLEDTWMNKI
ncbi:hypothetical protein FDP41_012649 [Naegleria fowleri]|uniref:Uncharacterized protein n=1 Tax=Naegleria fowleri TaxID=5763 RepID=A0A6A5C1J4_NAEFO|nr:uncharacterized protein FDP41_012649 [Naegleria fowleri]KAF0980861.1 hypothetical protein FDP41_012649 [Naegleria fowleri]CAG4709966.1 unnamed protein product [Naegleria fowleri]